MQALVADLPAALGVERGAVEHRLHMRAGPGRPAPGAPSTSSPRSVPSLTTSLYPVKSVVPGMVHHLAIDGRRGEPRLADPRVGLGALPLLGHQPAEPVLVHLDARVGRHLQRDLEGESVRVVQGEHLVAGQHRAARVLRTLATAACRASSCRARASRRTRPPRRRRPTVIRPASVTSSGYCGPIASIAAPISSPMVGSWAAEQAHLLHHAPQDPAQDVAAALVAGQHAVADQERARAGVVGHDPQVDVHACGRRRSFAPDSAIARSRMCRVVSIS